MVKITWVPTDGLEEYHGTDGDQLVDIVDGETVEVSDEKAEAAPRGLPEERQEGTGEREGRQGRLAEVAGELPGDECIEPRPGALHDAKRGAPPDSMAAARPA